MCGRSAGADSLAAEYRDGGFDGKNHRPRVNRAAKKTEFRVKCDGFVIKSVDEDRSKADFAIYSKGAEDSISQQATADPLALITTINGKPADDDDRR